MTYTSRIPPHKFVDHELVGFMRVESGLCHATIKDRSSVTATGSHGCVLPREHPVHKGKA
jgi:hypothetical protein